MPGLFIAFEGIDSAGKKTQIKLLANRLRESGKEVVTISFPSYDTDIGKLIKGWISRSLSMSNETASLLYAADRMQNQIRIKEWLKKGWVVITDRYCYSNITYQNALGLSKEWLISIEKPIIKPDLVILLNIPEMTASTRGTRQETLQSFLDIKEEKPVETLRERVRKGFLDLSNNPPYQRKWFVIDGTRPVEEVHTEIFSMIQERLT
jgi:dTMP kinase